MSEQPDSIDQTSLDLRIDQVSDSFESAIKAGQSPDIVEFLSANGLPLAPRAFAELLGVELEYRRRSQKAMPRQEYIERYPAFRELIEEEFAKTQTFTGHVDSTATAAKGLRRREFQVGESVDDFDLLRCIGQGAFATVFLARQRSMQRRVALKISHYGTDESRTLAKLDHPNIVRVYDQRVLNDESLHLIYMEYVPAGSLADVIAELQNSSPQQRDANLLFGVIDRTLREREEPLPTAPRDEDYHASWGQTVCALGARLAEALDYAHRRETLHRDVKPGNILLMPDGTPKLVDFNIAYSALVEGAEPDDTFGGSLAYMSPEQLRAASNSSGMSPKDLDGRSDVFSLGVVLWELLTGERPFADEQERSHWTALAAEMARARSTGLSTEQTQKLESVTAPDGLSEVILRCLKPNREDRFGTAGEVSRQLDLCLHPKARRLVEPKPGGFPAWVQRCPMRALLCVALLPNVILSVYNVAYDVNAIGSLNGITQFSLLQMLYGMNCVLYAIGIGGGVRWAWPILNAAWHIEQKTRVELVQVRRRSLLFGDIVFRVSMLAWTFSGVMIPLLLATMVKEGAIQDYFHIFMSHLLCGLIASTLTTFPLAYLVSRVFYPLFLRADKISAGEQDVIASAERRLELYARLVLLVPLVSISLLWLTRPDSWLAPVLLLTLAVASWVAEIYLSRARVENFRALICALGDRHRSSSLARNPRSS